METRPDDEQQVLVKGLKEVIASVAAVPKRL